MLATFRFVTVYWLVKNMLLLTVLCYNCDKFHKYIQEVDEVCYRLLSINQEIGEK